MRESWEGKTRIRTRTYFIQKEVPMIKWQQSRWWQTQISTPLSFRALMNFDEVTACRPDLSYCETKPRSANQGDQVDFSNRCIQYHTPTDELDSLDHSYLFISTYLG